MTLRVGGSTARLRSTGDRVAIVAVALDDREEISVGCIVGDASAPVWVVLVAAGVAGIVIGWLISHRPRYHN